MKRRDGQLLGGSAPLRGGLESRLPGASTGGSGNYYRAESPTAGSPVAQRGQVLPQQQILRRQQARGVLQQHQTLPPLESDKNVITLYHSVITATIQRCAQLQNAKVLDAIERHWRIALQRRTAELRRSGGSSVLAPTRSGTGGDNQQQQQSRPPSKISSSSRSNSCIETSSASAAEPIASQLKRERKGTVFDAVVSNGGSQTLPSTPAAVGQKQEHSTSVDNKTDAITADHSKILLPGGNTLSVNIKQEQSPIGDSARQSDAARGQKGGAAALQSNAVAHSVQDVKEEDDEDDEFADADVDEAKPAAEAAEPATAGREEAATSQLMKSDEKGKQTTGNATADGATPARDMTVRAHYFAGVAEVKAGKEHVDSKFNTHYKQMEALDFEQPESLDDVSDIDDQEPPTTDGIFALYEKVQRCGSSGRKATNWKVTLRHGIIRAAHQEIAFDRLHAELRF